VLALTPFELMALFTRERGDGGRLDRVAELHRHNHALRAPKGTAPSTPRWLMRDVPRAD
jgi:hypothetical protein